MTYYLYLQNCCLFTSAIDFNVVNPSNNTFNRQKIIITIFVNERKCIFEKNFLKNHSKIDSKNDSKSDSRLHSKLNSRLHSMFYNMPLDIYKLSIDVKYKSSTWTDTRDTFYTHSYQISFLIK
jgi:hypothetical protein